MEVAERYFTNLTPAERNQLIQKQLLAKAQKAKTDPCAFVEFVLKKEDDNSRINLAAVQELMIEFALHAQNEHDRALGCVIIAPVEHSKSSSVGIGLTLFKLAKNPDIRAAYVCAAAAQARKNLNSIRSYIESSHELRLVAPELQRSDNAGDPWTQAAITVNRPNKDAHDPTVQAFGFGAQGLTGSRLEWIIVDDILSFENTRTKEQREKVQQWVQAYVINRRTKNGRVVVINSALHPEDLCHYLCFKLRWPTMILDAYGAIQFHNTTFGQEGKPGADLIEPESIGSSVCVLSKIRKKHVDEPDKQVLFPERFTVSRLDAIRESMDLIAFLQSYRSITRNDDDSMCKEEYIQRCKDNGRAIRHYAPVRGLISGAAGDRYAYTGQNVVFISVDLAVKQRDVNDKVAIACVELVPRLVIEGRDYGGIRVLLDIETGRWPGPDIVKKIIGKVNAYGPNTVVVVEDNGAQAFIRQFIQRERADIPVVPFNTTAEKHKFEYGIPRVFTEFANGAWVFPCTEDNRCVAPVEQLITDCLYYKPDAHTGDSLMAIYFAMDQCRRYMGAYDSGARGGGKSSLGASIMSR